jgi:hypothetical protein
MLKRSTSFANHHQSAIKQENMGTDQLMTDHTINSSSPIRFSNLNSFSSPVHSQHSTSFDFFSQMNSSSRATGYDHQYMWQYQNQCQQYYQQLQEQQNKSCQSVNSNRKAKINFGNISELIN